MENYLMFQNNFNNASVQVVKECVEKTMDMWLVRSKCLIDDRNFQSFSLMNKKFLCLLLKVDESPIGG